MSAQMNVPKLRFPEFNGEWEEKKLGSYGKLVNGLTYSPDNIVENGLLVLRSSNVQNNQLTFDDNVYVNLEVSEESLTKENDILICVRNGSKRLIGKNVIIPSNLPKATHGAFMTVFRGEFNSFISHWLETPMYYEQVHQNLGATINSINGSDLKKFQTIFPPKSEQTKIATFLTAIDTKIEQLTKKQTLLKQYKKGVMQKLFSQELRFKADDGSEFSDWEEKTLGEVAKFRRGSFPQPYGLPEWYDDENGMPFIQVYDVDDNMKLKPKTKNKISKLAQPSSVFVEKGNIILTIQGSIGRIALTQYDAFVDRTLLIFTEYKKPIDKNFFIYLVFLLFEIEKMKAPGGTIKTITKEALTEFKIKLPCIKEQTKIANFLTSIYTKIGLATKQLNATKQFKKALLQQMFI
jgi:type I restriction enzyme S subunit